jgi:hypothetical protein
MNLKKFFSILLTTSISHFSFSQNATSEKPTLELPQTSIKAAFLGSVIYPGFKLGIERPYKVIQKEKRNGRKIINKERAFALNLGFYHHETFHDNLFLLGEWQFRRQKSSGWFREFAPGVGVSKTFLGGTTYNVDDKNTVTINKAAGYTYAVFSVATGFGYDFSVKKDKPFKLYIKPSILVMASYNNFIYARPTIELGINYKLNSFLKASPKLITRN